MASPALRRSSFLSLVLELDRQVHAHPPRRQAHALLLVHAHAGVVALDERDVRPLRAHVREVLLGLRRGHCAVAIAAGRRRRGRRMVEVLAQAVVERRPRRGEDRAWGKLSQERPVEGAQLGGRGCRHWGRWWVGNGGHFDVWW